MSTAPTNNRVKCPRCGKQTAYWMADSHNLWCINCKAVVK